MASPDMDIRLGAGTPTPAAAVTGATRRCDDERRVAQLAAVVETSSEALLSVAPDGTILTWNPAAERLFGYTEAEAVGRNITLISPERDYSPTGIAGSVLKEGRIVRVRTERIHKNGARMPVSISAAPMRNEAGEIIGVSSVIRDNTATLRAEERQQLMMRELAHRGKNLLAVIQSIARHSLTTKGCTVEARDGFIDRVAALARTYQTLNAEGFEGARLSELVRLELEGFSSRVHAFGPDVLLRTNEAQTFGLMLHELTTNAVKFGALSNEDGRVDVIWDVDADAAEPQFIFEWTENGGPVVEARTHRGFGSTLTSSVVEQSFATTPEIEFHREGLRYRFKTALAHVGRRLEASPLRSRIRSKCMRALYDAWWRENGMLPSLEEIEGTTRAYADHVAIAEIDQSTEPAALKFLSIGRNIERGLAKRFDVTLGDANLRDIPGSIEATYRRCARGRDPVYEFSIIDAGGRDPLVLERLIVPCSRDGLQVTNLVGMAINSDPE